MTAVTLYGKAEGKRACGYIAWIYRYFTGINSVVGMYGKGAVDVNVVRLGVSENLEYVFCIFLTALKH